METQPKPPARRSAATLPILLNAGARALRHEGEATARERVVAACRAAGLDAHVEMVEPGDMERAVRAAVEAGASRVAVGGGDGTVRTAAQVLAGQDTALGILPLGTLNHCARDLGLPTDLEAAVRVLVDGTTRSVDLGDLDGQVFVNNSAIGLYPYLVHHREKHERRFQWSRMKALAHAAWRTFWRFPVLEFHVRRPAGIGTIRSPLVFIGNNEYAFGPALGSRPRLDQGVLWLCAVKPTGRWRFLWLCLRSLVVPAPHATHFIRHLLEEVAIDLPHSTWVSLDGEVRRMRGQLVYRLRPGALKVVVGPSPEPLAEPKAAS